MGLQHYVIVWYLHLSVNKNLFLEPLQPVLNIACADLANAVHFIKLSYACLHQVRQHFEAFYQIVDDYIRQPWNLVQQAVTTRSYSFFGGNGC